MQVKGGRRSRQRTAEMKKAGGTLLNPRRKNRSNGFYGFINYQKELT